MTSVVSPVRACCGGATALAAGLAAGPAAAAAAAAAFAAAVTPVAVAMAVAVSVAVPVSAALASPGQCAIGTCTTGKQHAPCTYGWKQHAPYTCRYTTMRYCEVEYMYLGVVAWKRCR